MNDKTTVYVDSNVFIRPLVSEERSSTNVAACMRVLSAVEGGKIVAYTSTLTWDEVVYIVRRVLGKVDSIQAGDKIQRFPNLRFISASEDIIRAAQKLMSESHALPRDAIHAASALSRKVDVFISDDADFDAIEGIHRRSSAAFVH